jgi:hypothetical protein
VWRVTGPHGEFRRYEFPAPGDAILLSNPGDTIKYDFDASIPGRMKWTWNW